MGRFLHLIDRGTKSGRGIVELCQQYQIASHNYPKISIAALFIQVIKNLKGICCLTKWMREGQGRFLHFIDRDTNDLPLLDCVWKFEEELCQQNGQCQIASPGYPGIYPPNTRCRFHVAASSKDVQIKLTFTRFNLPQA